MAEQRAEVAAIRDSGEEPTFDNTVVALERSGRLLSRAWAVFGNLTSSVSTPRMREIEREIAPLEAAHDDALRLDPALFARLDAVHAARHDGGLDDESVRLVERYHLDFVLAGARLDEAGRARLTELNQELSTLSTTFGQNLQLATEAAAVRVDDAARAGRAERGGDRHRGGRGRRPRAGRVPADAGAAHRPAAAPEAAQPRPAPPRCSRRRWAGRRRASTTTARSPCGSRSCGPSARGCSASTRTPTSSSPTRPRAPPAAVDAMLASMVPASVANAEAEAAMLRRGGCARRRRAGRLGLGLLRRAGAGRAVRRRHRRPAAVVRAGPGAGRRRLPRRRTALRLPVHAACRPRRVPPRRPRVGGDATPTVQPSASTSATSSPARASAAAPG